MNGIAKQKLKVDMQRLKKNDLSNTHQPRRKSHAADDESIGREVK